MSWARVSLTELDRRSRGRVVWADVAKAISIILLVLWTTVGDAVYVNELLILVRMPLFFFVAGVFAWRMVIEADLGTFLRDRVGNLVYLFALWTWILFLTTRFAAHLAWGARIDPWAQLRIFWDPPLTIWFLYALAIATLIARLARGLPALGVLAAALAVYSACVWFGDWRDMGFAERLARLFPFFWVGLIARPLAVRLVEARWRLWPAIGALFLGLAWAVFDTPLAAVGPLTFAITLVGVLWLLCLARWLSRFAWSRPLAVVGAATLHVYVMQRVLLFYLEHGFAKFGLDAPAWGVAQAALIVGFGALVGPWLARRPATAWLFAAPWTGDRSTPSLAPTTPRDRARPGRGAPA
jgi:uncharacterized membrane protein YcfT